MWSVRSNSGHLIQLPAAITYGASPASGVELTAAKPLDERTVYTVTVSGGGYFGGAVFKIVDGKVISEQGTGDAPFDAVARR